MTVNRTLSFIVIIGALMLALVLTAPVARSAGNIGPSLDVELATVHWAGMVADDVYPHERPDAWKAVRALDACTLWEDRSMVCTVIVAGIPDHVMRFDPDGRITLAPIPADANRYWQH